MAWITEQFARASSSRLSPWATKTTASAGRSTGASPRVC